MATLLASARPTCSQVLLITKKDFTITFPDGWTVANYPGMPMNDSGFMVMDTSANEAFAFAQGQKTTGALTASQLASIYTSAYTIDFARTDSTNKVLGKYTFSTVGYKDTAADGDPTSRFRFYVTTQGNYVFVAWLVYNTDTGPASMARMEAALATLNITALAGIRNFATINKSKVPGQYYDIQGRNWDFLNYRMNRVPVFKRP